MALHFTLTGLQAPSWQLHEDTMMGRADRTIGCSVHRSVCLSVENWGS